jgi:hypothetical protein
LPKFHKQLGYNVEIIASNQSYNSEGEVIYFNGRSSYLNENGILVYRVPYRKPQKLFRTLRVYKGLRSLLSRIQPDILFIHGCQFLDIKEVLRYKQINKSTKIFIDNHADFSNSARNIFSRIILHQIIWKFAVKRIIPYVEKFFGVLPARVDFLTKMYNVPKEKTELLIMGADDLLVEKYYHNKEVSNQIRSQFKVQKKEKLVITGGKIDKSKIQVLNLMRYIRDGQHPLKLIVFGSIAKDLEKEFLSLVDNKSVYYIGWIDNEMSYKYLTSSDFIVFPGRHSVYWEQAAALGKPLILKYWDGTDHINVNNNVLYLLGDSEDYLIQALAHMTNPDEYERIKYNAESAREYFLYSKIARQSLGNISS